MSSLMSRIAVAHNSLSFFIFLHGFKPSSQNLILSPHTLAVILGIGLDEGDYL